MRLTRSPSDAQPGRHCSAPATSTGRLSGIHAVDIAAYTQPFNGHLSEHSRRRYRAPHAKLMPSRTAPSRSQKGASFRLVRNTVRNSRHGGRLRDNLGITRPGVRVGNAADFLETTELRSPSHSVMQIGGCLLQSPIIADLHVHTAITQFDLRGSWRRQESRLENNLVINVVWHISPI